MSEPERIACAVPSACSAIGVDEDRGRNYHFREGHHLIVADVAQVLIERRLAVPMSAERYAVLAAERNAIAERQHYLAKIGGTTPEEIAAALESAREVQATWRAERALAAKRLQDWMRDWPAQDRWQAAQWRARRQEFIKPGGKLWRGIAQFPHILGCLTPAERAVVLLRRDGLMFREISKRQGFSAGRAHQLFQGAVVKLCGPKGRRLFAMTLVPEPPVADPDAAIHGYQDWTPEAQFREFSKAA